MKTSLFLIIVLASGFSAGVVYGTANLFLVEPYLDKAILIENQNLFASGEEQDTPEFWVQYDAYRYWQKSGQVLAGAILGIALGSLFGIVFVLSKDSLPGKNRLFQAMILSGIFWVTIYLVPFLKYPANPPTVGDPETIVLRSLLYVSLIALSGLGALVFFKISQKLKSKKKILGLVGYVSFIVALVVILPENPDSVTAPSQLVEGFRMATVFSTTIFWASLGVILGLLWYKFKPDYQLEKSIK